MDPKSTDFESYAAGYRQAVCDLVPVDAPKTEPGYQVPFVVKLAIVYLIVYLLLKITGGFDCV